MVRFIFNRAILFWKIWTELLISMLISTNSILFLGSYTLSFSHNKMFLIEIEGMCNIDHCQIPCMLLLCVCWWKWCEVDLKMLLLLELVELLLGLGVAIVVLGSSVSTRIRILAECGHRGRCFTSDQWTRLRACVSGSVNSSNTECTH